MDLRSVIEQSFNPTDDQVCSTGNGGMVASAHPAATEAGRSILKKGGNAVDGAVATALALCVCEPQACSIGGQSYGLLHVAGKSRFLDGSGRVPIYLEKALLTYDDMCCGYRGSSVPTTPLVLACMQKRWGKLSWKETVEPAMALAFDGYVISQLQHDLQKREHHYFSAVPGNSGARYFLKDNLTPYQAGETFSQPELGMLLKRLADKGIEEFYTGETARQIAADMARNSGFLAEEDLKAIPWPHERPVITQKVFGHTMITTPPPTQGRLLAYIMKTLEELALRGVDLLADDSMKLFADLFFSAYRIRMEQSPYPDLYSDDIDEILAPETIARMADLVQESAVEEVQLASLAGGETTHLSVMDEQGNCVGITQSVNMVYGSKAAADGLGFLYNNYLIDSFDLPERHPHALVPGRTAPCSVSPFILMGAEGRPWLTAGSPGSQRIVTALTLFLVRLLHGSIPMDEAMARPRYHCQDFKKILVEQGKYPNGTLDSLKAKGFEIDEFPSFYFGAVHAVLKKRQPGKFQGVAEVRRDGTAAGVYES